LKLQSVKRYFVSHAKVALAENVIVAHFYLANASSASVHHEHQFVILFVVVSISTRHFGRISRGVT